jgi:hypothetical protein
MTIRQELEKELEETRLRYLALLDSIPESDYSLPTDNPDWNVGEMLYHITLGPPTLAFETWMITHVRGLFKFGIRVIPSSWMERLNGLYAQRGGRITRQGLIKGYEAGHTRIMSRLKRTRDEDFSKVMEYPDDFLTMLTGTVTIERLFHYVKQHFEEHQAQLGKSSENHL